MKFSSKVCSLKQRREIQSITASAGPRPAVGLSHKLCASVSVPMVSSPVTILVCFPSLRIANWWEKVLKVMRFRDFSGCFQGASGYSEGVFPYALSECAVWPLPSQV